MAQSVSEGVSRSVSGGQVTVAELLSRNAPVPEREGSTADTGAHIVTVGSLLRREGFTPHTGQATDGEETGAAAPTGADRGALVRRSAVAAGALLAAGSVFGAAALNDATLSFPFGGNQAGEDHHDATSGATGATAFGATAGEGGPDAGVAAPQNWMPIAFPSVLTAAPRAVNAARNATGTGTPTAPAAGTGTTGGSTAAPTSGGGVGGVLTGLTKDLGDTVKNATSESPALSPVGDLLGGVVSGAGGAVGGLVSGLGETVKETPKTLRAITDPLSKALPITAPVTNLLLGTADTLTSAPHGAGGGSSDRTRASGGSSTARNSLPGLPLGSGKSAGATKHQQAEPAKHTSDHRYHEDDYEDNYEDEDDYGYDDHERTSSSSSRSSTDSGSTSSSSSSSRSNPGLLGVVTSLVGGLLGG